MADVDAVIVAFRSRDAITGCIRAARAVPNLGRVIVVDHGDDGTAVLAAADGAIVMCNPANPGFAAGQNQGLSAARARYVLVLNPDARVRGEAVADGVRYLDDHPGVAAVQGVIRRAGTHEVERSAGEPIGPRHLLGRLLHLRAALRVGPIRRIARRLPSFADHVDRVPVVPSEVDWLATTAPLIRREALEGIGRFDSRYFLYGEDADLCRRLRNSGWRLVTFPEPWADHEGAASSGSAAEADLRYWAGTLQYAAQWWPRPEWAVGLAVAVGRAAGFSIRFPRRWRMAWSQLVAGPIRHRRRTRSNTALSQPREKRA